MEKEREGFLEEIDKAFVKRKRKREADGTSATLGWKRSDISTTTRHPLSHARTQPQSEMRRNVAAMTYATLQK
jgi:hypothetical protein